MEKFPERLRRLRERRGMNRRALSEKINFMSAPKWGRGVFKVCHTESVGVSHALSHGRFPPEPPWPRGGSSIGATGFAARLSQPTIRAGGSHPPRGRDCGETLYREAYSV